MRGTVRTMSLLSGTGTQTRRAHHLLRTGRVGRATVATVRQTGNFVNDDPECELELQVSVDGETPYRVLHRQALAAVALPGLRPGASVPVRVDPDDPLTLVIA